MTSGWAGKILYINLSTGEVTRKSTFPYVRKYIGGRILAARLAWEYIPEEAGPFDEDNTIIIVAGPLSGTIAPTSGRTLMSMISPVPYPFPWYTHSSLGGWFAMQMKSAGYDVLMIKGKSSKKAYIEIKDETVEIKEASDLWGKDAIESQEILKKILGTDTQVMAIGPAGENQGSFATVQHDFDCAAGHSGFGAVWGSKNLKAIAVRGSGDIKIAHPDKLLAEWAHIGKYCTSSENKFLLYGSNRDVPASKIKKAGPICTQGCTNNCHQGEYVLTTDSRTINTFCIGRHFAGKTIPDYSRPGTDIRFPAIRSFDPESGSSLIELFNRLGIDYWMRITLQCWLIAVKEAGIDEIRGYPINPNNSEWFLGFIRDVAYCKALGALFSSGLAPVLDNLKGELPEKVILVGREIVFDFGFQAHREGRFWNEEPLPYWIFAAMMYISETRDPTIGSHTLMHLADIQIAQGETAFKKFRILAKRVWNDPGALEPNFNFEQKARVAIWSQRMHQLIDSLPMCDFAFPRLIKPYNNIQEWLEDEDIYGDLDLDRRLLNAVTGENFTREELDRAADRAFSIERCLLARSGRGRKQEETLAYHFQLPCRDDGTFLTRDDFLKLMDAYYEQRGWDMQDGWPSKGTLTELEIEDVALEMESRRQSRKTRRSSI